MENFLELNNEQMLDIDGGIDWNSIGMGTSMTAGVLYKKRGIGMFVSSGAKETIREKRRSQFYENYVSALIDEAKTLGITKDELIAGIEKDYEN